MRSRVPQSHRVALWAAIAGLPAGCCAPALRSLHAGMQGDDASAITMPAQTRTAAGDTRQSSVKIGDRPECMLSHSGSYKGNTSRGRCLLWNSMQGTRRGWRNTKVARNFSYVPVGVQRVVAVASEPRLPTSDKDKYRSIAYAVCNNLQAMCDMLSAGKASDALKQDMERLLSSVLTTYKKWVRDSSVKSFTLRWPVGEDGSKMEEEYFVDFAARETEARQNGMSFRTIREKLAQLPEVDFRPEAVELLSSAVACSRKAAWQTDEELGKSYLAGRYPSTRSVHHDIQHALLIKFDSLYEICRDYVGTRTADRLAFGDIGDRTDLSSGLDVKFDRLKKIIRELENHPTALTQVSVKLWTNLRKYVSAEEALADILAESP